MTSGESDIDPHWWAPAFSDADEDGPHRAIELASMRIADLAKTASTGTVQKEVLTSLYLATSATLHPGDWDEPFKAMIQWDGRRSPLPDDLSSTQLALLRRALPLVQQRPMRARLADVLWMAERSDHTMLGLAIDSYRDAALEPRDWHRSSHAQWQRAVYLALRRGSAELERIQEMKAALLERILGGDTSDGFVLCDMSDLLKQCVSTDPSQRISLGAKFVELAVQAADGNARLARHLERAAQQWLATVSDKEGLHASTARVAELFVMESDERLSAGGGAELAVDHYLEKAIATLRVLPRSYRNQHGYDQKIADLRRRMDDSRELILESMVSISTGPIDLTDAVAEVRRQVSGLDKFEALVELATIYPLTDVPRSCADAAELTEGSLRHLLGNVTYSSDGRKIAASSGIADDADSAVESDMMQRLQISTGIAVTGYIIPAHEVVTFEHRYELGYLRRICVEAPLVPQGHEDLWARGLRHGLNGDFPSGAVVLIPQLEQLVRRILKRQGVHTLFVESNGVESEKSLPALLAMPETTQVFGESLRYELQAQLVDQRGPNLRHNTAHGLLNDGQAWSAPSIYVWCLCLRLVVAPLWNMRRTGSNEADEEHP